MKRPRLNPSINTLASARLQAGESRGHDERTWRINPTEKLSLKKAGAQREPTSTQYCGLFARALLLAYIALYAWNDVCRAMIRGL